MPPIFLTAREAFAYKHQVGETKWSAYNLSRLLRATGERPERVAEMRHILGALGLGDYSWISTGGVFDHGEMWGRFGQPWMIVGHPYQIDEQEQELLAILSRYGTLRVTTDDYPGYYGHGTQHVRVELVEARSPYVKLPGTVKTRAAARAARKAFAEAFED